jgi:alpha-galactosidase
VGQAGSSRLTPDEQRTEVTLSAIARSPLIVGANLTLLDEPTLALLTNRAVIRVSQTATKAYQAQGVGHVVAWRSHIAGGEEALALSNTGDAEVEISEPLAAFDPALGAKACQVRDAWAGREPGKVTAVTGRIPAHGCVLLLLR